MKKWMVLVLLSLIFLGIYFVFDYFHFNDGKLHVVFCDVGQGDGILLRFPKNINVLIDSGPDQSILNCLSRHLPFWERNLNLVLLTHPHADHYFGLYYLIERYNVLSFDTEYLGEANLGFWDLVKKIENKRIATKIISEGDRWKIGDSGLITILSPQKNTPGNQLASINGEQVCSASLLSYGSFELLFTCDSQASGLDQITNKINQKISILQVPHHGSATGLDPQILEKLRPDAAIISVGRNNRYGHPNFKTLELLKEEKINTFRTDKQGDVEIISDGESYVIN